MLWTRNPLLLMAFIWVGSLIALGLAFWDRAPIKRSNWQMTAALQSPVVAAAPITLQFSAAPSVGDLGYKAGPRGSLALDAYNQGSALQDAGGAVRLFRRAVAGGELIYLVVPLQDGVRFEVLNADNAVPGSDASGDTIWVGGGQHLANVQEMATAAYAVRDGYELVGAMAFGFHGAVRTSNEGTVVINGVVHRVNPGRAALCIRPDGVPLIGLFDHAAAAQCAQAIGAGPVILLDGKIANPDTTIADAEFVPFNPLAEDFVQIDWRRHVYRGTYPKTAIGIGEQVGGGHYLVLAVSYGITGVDLAKQLRDMGCTMALGGDDDTSTQLIWRGAPTRNHPLREVPDAVAIYVRN